MKTIFINSILLIGLMLSASLTFAQDDSRKKVEEKTFQVKGVCKMCKARIESAALYTKGVKSAEWDKETGNLTVAYQTKKVDEKTIHKNIAAAGHDTSQAKASEEAYAELPGCCKYRDGVEVH